MPLLQEKAHQKAQQELRKSTEATVKELSAAKAQLGKMAEVCKHTRIYVLIPKAKLVTNLSGILLGREGVSGTAERCECPVKAVSGHTEGEGEGHPTGPDTAKNSPRILQ